MTDYRERIADRLVRDALTTFGAVVIQGARAVGKTTLGQQVAQSSVRLDSSPRLAELAEVSADAVLRGATPRLIDEWQLAPSLWNAVRHTVDERGVPGQFILTGSATPADDLTRHSGAGRFRRITLRPMALAESGESTGEISLASLFVAGGPTPAGIGGPTVIDYAGLLVRGGWPALVAQPARSATEYLGAYLDDIARVDLPGAATSVDPARMGALIRALARNVSTEATATLLARESGLGAAEPGGVPGESVSAQSVRRYADALARIFVLEEQPAWAPHLRSKVRLRVSPKWHFADPSLACAALDAGPEVLLADPEMLGLLFESLCVRDLRIYAQPIGGSVYHYRDETGLEVDAIVELRDGRWAAFEVKLGGERAVEGAAASLRKLRGKVAESRAVQLRSLNVLTAGELSYTRPDGVNVLALGHLAP
ncbi:MAG: ATP-binding protein [Sporichthyaceae bacterium]